MPITRLDMISMAPKTQEAGAYKQQEMQHATNQLDNPLQIAAVKKDIARIKTIIREKETNV